MANNGGTLSTCRSSLVLTGSSRNSCHCTCVRAGNSYGSLGERWRNARAPCLAPEMLELPAIQRPPSLLGAHESAEGKAGCAHTVPEQPALRPTTAELAAALRKLEHVGLTITPHMSQANRERAEALTSSANISCNRSCAQADAKLYNRDKKARNSFYQHMFKMYEQFSLHCVIESVVGISRARG